MSAFRGFAWPAALAALLPLSGCVVGGVHADGGYLTSTDGRPGRRGANLRARGALLPFAVSMRGKITKNVKQGAIEPEFVMPVPAPVPVYGALGANMLQLDSVDGKAAFGMFSPVGEVGVLIPLALQEAPKGIGVAGPFVIVNATAEYDIRFGDAPNEPFFSGNVGLGYFFAELDIPH